jgi:hypothetical protein
MEARIEDKSDKIIALVQDKLSSQPLFLPEASGGGTANDVVAEADEPTAGEDDDEGGEDMWGGEEVGQYLEEEFEEGGGDDFEPMLELDEVAEPQD